MQRAARGRRTQRPSGDDRELAILATAEALLEQRSLSEISIDDLARGAGISRPTFYFYFPSKDAVLLTLLDRVTVEAEAEVVASGVLSGVDGRRRVGVLARAASPRSTRRSAATGPSRSPARRCGATNPEVRRLWATVTENWVRLTTAAIEAERARGAAPPGLAARDLAIVLNAMNERAMHATFDGGGPAVAEPDVVDVLLDVWLKAIYGNAPGEARA